MLNWRGDIGHRYVHCLYIYRSAISCAKFGVVSIQGIYAQLTGEDLCLIPLCYANIFGVAVFDASMIDWRGDICTCALFDIYTSAIRFAKFGVVVIKASMLN